MSGSFSSARVPLGLRILRRPSGAVGSAVLALVGLAALSAEIVRPGDPLDMVAAPFLWPGTESSYPLGTDMLGRDLAAGLLYGARVSLLIGVVATAITLGIGIGVGAGALAGFYRGRLDQALMRTTELFQTIPPFLFALAIVAVLQPSLTTITFAIGVTAWPSLARIVRAEVLALRDGEMVQAAIALGAGDARILLLHILPNVLGPVLVSASILVATAILTESSLAFLGLGDPNVVSWGGMVGAGREVLRTDWYVAALPGLAIVAVVLGLNLLGDALADALDPRRTRR